MMMDTMQRVALAKKRALEKHRNCEKHTIQRLSLLSVFLSCCLIYSSRYFSGKSLGLVPGMNGATILLDNAGGYVLVGVVSFVLAVVVTILCLRIREKRKKE